MNADGTFSYTPDADFNGADSFTYDVVDGTDTETVTVTVNVDPTPDLVDDNDNATEAGAPIAGNLLTNDDIGTPVTNITAASEGATPITLGVPFVTANGGSLTLFANGNYDYTPPPAGTVPLAGVTETFAYTVTDANGNTDTATLTINVVDNGDLLPIAADDAFNTIEDTVLVGDVSANDPSPGDAPATYTAPAVTAQDGSLVMNGDGTFTYTPPADFFGTDSFVYTMTDNDGDFDTSTVTITVTAAPDLVDDAATVVEDNPLQVSNVLANDDLGAGIGSITAFDAISVNGGTVTAGPGNTFAYIPPADFFGTDTFTYTFTDGDGNTDTATVTVTVTAAPDLSNDNVNAVANTPLVLTNVLANDDLGAGAGSITAFDAASTSGGTVVAGPGNTFTYTPLSNFTGTDTFTYTFTDGDGNTDTATVTITVANGTPAAPIVEITEDANNDGIISADELNGNIDVTITLPASIVAGDTLTVTDGNVTNTITLAAADILSGKVATSFATPAPGDTITISATVNAGGIDSASGSDSATFNATGLPGAAGDLVVPDQLFASDDMPDQLPELVEKVLMLRQPGAVINAVEAATTSVLNDLIDGVVADSANNWDLNGLKGFSLKFGLQSGGETTIGITDISQFPLRLESGNSPLVINDAERDELVVQSLLFDKTLILELDYVTREGGSEVSSILATTVNQQPLPSWMAMDADQSLILGIPPVGTETVELRVEVVLENGITIVRYCAVNTLTGEISELERDGAETAQYRSFSDQLAMDSNAFAQVQDELMNALKGSESGNEPPPENH